MKCNNIIRVILIISIVILIVVPFFNININLSLILFSIGIVNAFSGMLITFSSETFKPKHIEMHKFENFLVIIADSRMFIFPKKSDMFNLFRPEDIHKIQHNISYDLFWMEIDHKLSIEN